MCKTEGQIKNRHQIREEHKLYVGLFENDLREIFTYVKINNGAEAVFVEIFLKDFLKLRKDTFPQI